MRIPYCLPYLQYQETQRHNPYHQRAPHASFVKVASRKVWASYPPCISQHLLLSRTRNRASTATSWNGQSDSHPKIPAIAIIRQARTTATPTSKT